MHVDPVQRDASDETFEVAPEQSMRWLRWLIPGRLQPWLRGLRKRVQLSTVTLEEPFRSVFPYTQTFLARQQNLVRLCGMLEDDGVEGAIVECGVLDGGTAALMGAATKASGRPLHLFDAWQGLPRSTARDGAEARKWEGQVVGSPHRVAEILERLGVHPSRVHFHRGWFHETFPHASIPRVAMLHVDCDFHEPTALCLERWYPHMAPGGFIQIDDYSSFQGCRLATDEFLARHPELRLERAGEGGTAYFIACPAR